MPVEAVEVSGLFPGAPYRYAARTPPGGLLFTAGACPLDEAGATVAPGDLSAQTRRALANLTAVLSAAGVGVADVVKTSVYVTARDRADLLTAWAEVAAAFAPHRPPSTLLGVTALGYPDQLVEIEAVAVLPADAGPRR